MTRRYTFHIEDPHDDPDRIAAAVATFERLGYPTIECPALETRLRRRERDGFLMQALDRMPGDTPRKKCRELAAAIARFEGTTWPRWRDHGTPPGGSKGISMVQSCLFAARQLGRLPASPEQIWNITTKSNGPSNFGDNPLQSADRDP